MELWVELTKPRRVAKPSKQEMHHFLHSGENWAHRAYCLLVWIESHGWYGQAALAILVFEIASLFVQDGGHQP